MSIRNWKKRAGSLAFLLSATLLLSGCSIAGRRVYFSSGSGFFGVFRIGDFTCPKNEAKVYLLNYRNLYGVIGGTDLFKGSFDTKDMENSLKAAVMSQLSRMYALNQYAKDQDITLEHQEKNRVEQAANKYYKSLSKAERKYLGVDENDIVTMYEHLALGEKVYSQLMSEVDDEVSEDESRVMDVQMIVTSKKETAEQVKNSLAAGSEFEVLSQYNEGGDFEIEMKRGDFPEEVEKAAFALENDKASDMIKGSDGKYYFVKCKSKYNEELSNENKQAIIEKRKSESIKTIVSNLDKNAYSELNQSLWNSMDIPEDSSMKTRDFFNVLHEYLNYT